MPNWCYNRVYFSGMNVSQAKKLFDKLVDEYKAGDGSGVKPDMITVPSSGTNPYLFNLNNNGDGTLEDVSYIYDTKWSPNISDLITVCKTLGCDFKVYYDELGCGIYGYTQMVNEVVTEVDLSHHDMDEVDYDEEKDLHIFRGQEYESSDECYDILLTEKLKQNNIL